MRRLPSIILLSHYLLAATVGGLLHDHGVRPCPADHGCGGAHGQEAEKHQRSTSESDAPSPARDGRDGDCRVCRFLSQKPVPAEPVDEPRVGFLVARLAAARPIRAVAGIPSTRHIRGPPRIA